MKRFYWMLLALAGLAAVVTASASLYPSGSSHKDETLAYNPTVSTADKSGTTGQTVKIEQQSSQEDSLLYRLSTKVPDVPTFIDRETLELMQQVAKIKRPDAAKLLIKCLAYNYNPGNQDEDRSEDMMIPAIKLLGDYFGESASPLLYEEGLATSKIWFRDRIALAVRTILPESDVERLKKQALSDVAIQPNAFEFHESLSAEHLDLQLNAPRDRRMAELERAIEEIQKRDEQRIQRLRGIVPQAPTVADRKSVDIMREAAQTKRSEAALLLTKCLAFNFDPLNQNELRSQEMMLPAIQLLKDYFGESVAPLLYQEAIASDKKWYQDRIALAARAILSAKTIGEMNARFSLNKTSNPNARDFAAALANPKLEIKFARPDDKFIEQLRDPSKRKGKR